MALRLWKPGFRLSFALLVIERCLCCLTDVTFLFNDVTERSTTILNNESLCLRLAVLLRDISFHNHHAPA
jgi:hypothetical protein